MMTVNRFPVRKRGMETCLRGYLLEVDINYGVYVTVQTPHRYRPYRGRPSEAETVRYMTGHLRKVWFQSTVPAKLLARDP